MARNLKLNIKNTQIAQAVQKGAATQKPSKKEPGKARSESKATHEKQEIPKEEPPKIKARSKSAFEDGLVHPVEELQPNFHLAEPEEESVSEKLTISDYSTPLEVEVSQPLHMDIPKEQVISPEALRAKLFKDVGETSPIPSNEPLPEPQAKAPTPPPQLPSRSFPPRSAPSPAPSPSPSSSFTKDRSVFPRERSGEKLGPTGRHVKDLIPPPRKPAPRAPFPPYSKPPERSPRPSSSYDPRRAPSAPYTGGPRRPPMATPAIPPKEEDRHKLRFKAKPDSPAGVPGPEEGKKPVKAATKEFRDLKPTKKTTDTKQFDARDRQGLRAGEDEGWRNKKRLKMKQVREEAAPVRPTSLKVRIPISIKDLAEKMKLKASQLIGKLFAQGVVATLNDLMEDETTIQLLGQDFGCDISIDTTQEERIRISGKTIKEEIKEADSAQLKLRPPVVAFMGHVDHGKTSLIDAIRNSNRVSGEAGAITQHMGAFCCQTPVGNLTILDTPGHEAFSAMRARGADVTDIVVLVIAGDEGIKQQTIEAIQHAKAAHVTIVVAINKCDKPNFNIDNVYRQLAEQDLLPEAWGGQTLTVPCSAVSKQGINELLQTLALQAEILELKADPSARARGTVIESELHKGMGSLATILVQNGTLRHGDAIVFGDYFGKVKTMRDENGKMLTEAPPSTPVAITGLSGLPQAGQEFFVVKNEKEAIEIAEARTQGTKQSNLLLKKKMSVDALMQQAAASGKKTLNVVIRADVQGSLEALKTALLKIESTKADINIIFTGVGEVSESDAQLAAASKAIILGFHTAIENHAESLVKEMGIQVRLHDIIYHAIDDIKSLMQGLLDKIPQETEKGKVLVKATFKSSHHGNIAGGQVIEGSIARSNLVKLWRDNAIIWKGQIASLKRVKEDVKEVQKGLECGVLLANFNEVKEGDIIEAYEITYLTQGL